MCGRICCRSPDQYPLVVHSLDRPPDALQKEMIDTLCRKLRARTPGHNRSSYIRSSLRDGISSEQNNRVNSGSNQLTSLKQRTGREQIVFCQPSLCEFNIGSQPVRHHFSMSQIEGFLMASDLLSCSRAAESMHISQSAFSQLIRKLEQGLGLQLFDRTTRRVRLTAAGEAMQQKMRRGLDAIDDAFEEAQAVARIHRGHIRVGTLSSLAVGIVTRTLTELRHNFPGVTVSMREDFNDALVDLVAAGETDLSVCSEVSPRHGLSFECLFEDELLLVIKQGTRLARSSVLDWKLLADEPLVLTARRTATRQHVAAALAAHGISKPIEHEVASTPTSLAMVRAGFGSAFVSRVALEELDLHGLKVARLREPAMRRMGIYRPTERPPSPACAKFEEVLRMEAARAALRLGKAGRRRAIH